MSILAASTLYGLAAWVGCITQLPQIYKSVKTQKVGDISRLSYSIAVIATGLNFAGGYISNSNIVIYGSLFRGVQLITMIYLKHKYKK